MEKRKLNAFDKACEVASRLGEGVSCTDTLHGYDDREDRGMMLSLSKVVIGSEKVIRRSKYYEAHPECYPDGVFIYFADKDGKPSYVRFRGSHIDKVNLTEMDSAKVDKILAELGTETQD